MPSRNAAKAKGVIGGATELALKKGKKQDESAVLVVLRL